MPLVPRLLVLVLVAVQDGGGCHQRQRPITGGRRRLIPREGASACYLLPLTDHKRVLRETTRPFGECQNSTVTILVDGQWRCVQTLTGRLVPPVDAMSCPDDGAWYLLGLRHVIGTQMTVQPSRPEPGERFVCYQLRRPERDPLFWRTHLEKTDLGLYYCKALYGFGTAAVALYLVADPDNVRHGFCFFAGSSSDVPRAVSPGWCQPSAGGVLALRAWRT
ncbi:hypothetical protein FJT64_004773 [Amphibalanus amphitrite]|uniref:Ig-like domain-containing protein n=1 Tax=Amphibalanus amphitrite TaxID=1232801 RepID=A0A6A4W277_AMPAM|nr:hypothetical protein FJT64_004773 [Amphibalanus amphitrite]